MGVGTVIFLYCIAAYGLSNMVVFGSGPFKIFEGLRYITNRISEHLGGMFQCMMCFPANLGWAASLVDWFLIKDIAFTPFNLLLAGTGMWWMALILDCCFTSGMVWIMHNVESFFESIANGTAHTESDDNDIINLHD